MIYETYAMKKILASFSIFVLLFVQAPQVLFAGDITELSVTPVIIDEKAKVRDILKESITITNTSNRKLNIFPSVFDVDITEGQQEFEKAEGREDRSLSLANWIELSRGVIELSPGEEKIIPFVVRVHLDAEPGDYHAQISFTEGTTRIEAEESVPLGLITLNVEVEPDIKEALQLNKFFTDNFFLSGDDVLFNFQVENVGNQELRPSGEIRVYNRKGEEIASVPVNQEGKIFSPEQAGQMASVWASAQGFGKYKAFLNLDYGETQRASVQDTVYFWIVPWKQMIGLFAVGVIAVIFLVFYYHKRMEQGYRMQPAPVPIQPEPISEAVASNGQKNGWFNFGKKKPSWKVQAEWPRDAHIEQKIEETTEQESAPTVHTPMPPQHPEPHHATTLHVEKVQAPASQPQGGTINLKELCKDMPQARDSVDEGESHVINLRQ